MFYLSSESILEKNDWVWFLLIFYNQNNEFENQYISGLSHCVSFYFINIQKSMGAFFARISGIILLFNTVFYFRTD